MNSSNKKIIAIAVVLVLLLGIFFVTKDKMAKKSMSSDAEVTGQMEVKDGETVMSGSILDLIKSGGTSKCTYTSKQADVQMTGTTYVSGKQMRNDTEMTLGNGTKMESHMISDGTWIYSWTSAMPQGFKMNIKEAEEKYGTMDAGTTKPEANQEATMKNFQDKFDFKCSKWGVDASKFELPKGITFMDFSETMKKLNNNGSMCAACDYATDANAKAQCKAQLGCK
jgi:hypothetical protein